MYTEIAKAMMDSSDSLNRQFFVWQMQNKSNDLEQFFENEVLPELDHCMLALAVNQGLTYEEAEVEAYIKHGYLVYPESSIEVIFNEVLQMKSESILDDVPKYLQEYIDIEDYAKELECYNTRAEIISGEDWEETQEIDGVTYYIFKY